MPQIVPELPSTFTLDDVALLLGIALAAAIAYLIVRRLLAATRDEQVRTLCRRLLLADYVTDLRAAVRSPVATRPAPDGMMANEDPAYIRARLAGLSSEKSGVVGSAC